MQAIHLFIRINIKEITAAVFFITAYLPTIFWMWERWFSRNSYYSHGILVPLIVVFLIFQKRDELKLIRRKESAWGLPLIVAGILLHIASALFRVYFTSGFSMLIVLTGFILYFYGEEIYKKISFPVCFLVFMVPLPMVVITNISFKMKLFAAEIATLILNRVRIPAIREGSTIKMRETHVVVDDVCSGLRSLIALTALGSIFAYWMKGPMVKKMILFLSTIPIAIITNVCRVIFLSAVGEIYGPQYAVGFIHDFSGLMIFALAFILLYTVAKLLE